MPAINRKNDRCFFGRRVSYRTSDLFVVVLIATIVAGGLPSLVFAQETPPEDTADVSGKEKAPDAAETAAGQDLTQRVLSRMHQVNQMEMQAGKLAWEKGNSESVRNYGERLFRDHRFGDRKVTGLAEARGIKLVQPKLQSAEAKKRMKEMKQMMAKLKKMEGPSFDDVFLKMMVQGHKHSIQTLRQATEKLDEGEVRELVVNLIPILEQHLTLAQNLQS